MKSAFGIVAVLATGLLATGAFGGITPLGTTSVGGTSAPSSSSVTSSSTTSSTAAVNPLLTLFPDADTSVAFPSAEALVINPDAAKTWTGAANDGDWTNGTNWGGSAPLAADTVSIPGGLATVYPIINNSVTIASVVVDNAGSNATLTVTSGGSLTVTGAALTVNATGTLTVNGGSLTATAASLTGAGTINVSGTGTFSIKDYATTGTNNLTGGTLKVAHDFKPTGGVSATGGTVEFTGVSGGAAFTLPAATAYSPAQTISGSNITATQTNITASGTAIQNGDVILVETEQMLVTGGGGTTTLTVVRGYAGTAAAVHNTGKAITQIAVWGFYNVTVDAGSNPGFNSDKNTIRIAGTLNIASTPNSAFGLAAGTISTAGALIEGGSPQAAGSYGGTGCAATCTAQPTFFPATPNSTGKITVSTGAASKLAITTQPTNTVAGTTISTVTVAVEDASSNIVTSDNSTQVSLAIVANPGSGTLTGGGAVTVVNGVATFSGLSIDKVGTGYTLSASSTPSFTGATTNTFNITTRSSSTSVSCATNPVTYGGSTLCTATVSDSQGSGTSSTPGGSIAFTTNGSGSFSASGSCTLSSGSCAVTYTPSAVGTGTHQITATFTASDSIHAGSNNNTSVTVNKAALTVTPDPQSRTYGQAAPAYTFSVTGFQFSDNAGNAAGYVAPSCTSDYTTATTVASSPRTISCSGGSASNYTFTTAATANLTVSKASLTVTPDPQSRTYGQAVPSYTFSVTGFQNGQSSGTASGYSAPSCTSDYTTATTVANSPRTISCSGGSADNYSFNVSATANLTVTKASLTVTPDPQSRTYGQAAPSYTFSVTGFQNSQNSGTASGYVAPSCTSDYTTATTVANSPRTISCSGGSADNYSFNVSATANLTVTKASLTVTPDPQSPTYGQAVPSYTFLVTGFQNGQNSGTASGYSAPSCTSDYTTATTVANSPRTISCSGGSADNYSFNVSATANLTVTKAGLTVTPDPQSRTYGQAVPSYTFSVTGFKNGQNSGTASGYSAPSCTSDYSVTTTVAQSPRTISCSGGSADNYSFNTSATANLTVTKASLTVTPDPQSRTYGQSAPSYTFSVTGFKNGQNSGTASGYSAPSCTSDYTATTAVASSPRTISCSAGSADNYSFDTSSAANLTVNARALTITADNRSKVYGTSLSLGNSAFTTNGNEVGTEQVTSVTLTSTSGNDASTTASVGTYSGDIVPSAATGSNGFLASNYNITYAGGDLTITTANFTTTSIVRVDGQPTVGSVATITNGVYAPLPTSRSYQWEKCDNSHVCSNIGGATSNHYTPVAGDVGFTLVVVETVSRANYNDNGSTSIESSAVVNGDFATSTAVSIDGTPTVGAAATLTAGSYSPSAGASSYQWRLCDAAGANCADIPSATTSSYTPVATDAGSTLRVVETVSTAGYNDSGSTSAAALVAKGSFTTNTDVAIAGGTPTVGTPSTLTGGSYTPSPAGRTYQWQRCDSSGANCVNLGGATLNTYTPVAGDVGSKLRVVETVRKTGYNDGSSTSAASALVVNGSFATNSSVSVSGTPKVGKPFAATAGSYSPTPASSSYQWQLCDSTGNNCLNITGATGSSYTPVGGNDGSTLKVIETVSLSGYNNGSSTSGASAIVSKGDFTTTSSVAINGQPKTGIAVTITNGVYSPTPTSRSYQWQLCDINGANCSDIGGATTNTYTPVAGDVGSTLRVVETASRTGFADGGSTSGAVLVKGTFATVTAIATSGTPTVGTYLNVTTGTYSPSPANRGYAWERCDTSGNNCVTISGATLNTYKPVAADVGKTLRVVETATSPYYINGGSTSAATPLVIKGTFVTKTQVAILGNPKKGVLSKITPGSYSVTPASRSYQWLRCSDLTLASCVVISGATAKSYTPVAGDVGMRLRVVETVHKAGYNDLSVTSLASAKVTS